MTNPTKDTAIKLEKFTEKLDDLKQILESKKEEIRRVDALVEDLELEMFKIRTAQLKAERQEKP
jgi:hypothetical protein